MPKLIVRDRQRTVLVDLDLDEALVVGRSHTCDLPVDAPRASRRHAVIEPGATPDAGHVVRDLASTNGTQVGGVPIQVPHPLRHRDEIDIGGALLTYWREP